MAADRLLSWSPRAASAALAAIGGLHVVWATGSSWPASTSGSISGRGGSAQPSAAACLSVAGLLGTASVLVAGRPRRAPALRRLGAGGVIAVLTTRGAFGLAGRTDLLSPGSTSEDFRRLDRRFYSPLCLALAALSLPAATAWAR